jgi:hypothetical protein
MHVVMYIVTAANEVSDGIEIRLWSGVEWSGEDEVMCISTSLSVSMMDAIDHMVCTQTGCRKGWRGAHRNRLVSRLAKAPPAMVKLERATALSVLKPKQRI